MDGSEPAFSRFLFCPWPATGDFLPLLTIAEELESRDHQVAFYTSETMLPRIDTRRFRFFAASSEAYTSGETGGSYVEKYLLNPLPHMIDELLEVVENFHPHALVDGVMPFGPRVVSELTGIPQASVCVMGCLMASRDLFPYGTGRRPPANGVESAMARLANSEMEKATAHETEQWNQLRSRMGLPPSVQHPWSEPPSRSLILLPCTPEFEYPRNDMPAQTHFAGPILPKLASDPSSGFHPPRRPAVYVSQGTSFTQDLRILRLALDAMQDEPVSLIVCTGRHCSASELGSIPANAIVETFIPHESLFPNIDVVITHGGSGTVHGALAHGIPVVVLPLAVDQPENAERCVQADVGIRLDANTCAAAELRDAVRRALYDPALRENARRMQTAYQGSNGARKSADLLEILANQSYGNQNVGRTAQNVG